MPELNSSWKYIGPGDGQGELHKVIIINGPNEIITIGQTHSWLGSNSEFLRHFRRAK